MRSGTPLPLEARRPPPPIVKPSRSCTVTAPPPASRPPPLQAIHCVPVDFKTPPRVVIVPVPATPPPRSPTASQPRRRVLLSPEKDEEPDRTFSDSRSVMMSLLVKAVRDRPSSPKLSPADWEVELLHRVRQRTRTPGTSVVAIVDASTVGLVRRVYV